MLSSIEANNLRKHPRELHSFEETLQKVEDAIRQEASEDNRYISLCYARLRYRGKRILKLYVNKKDDEEACNPRFYIDRKVKRKLFCSLKKSGYTISRTFSFFSDFFDEDSKSLFRIYW